MQLLIVFTALCALTFGSRIPIRRFQPFQARFDNRIIDGEYADIEDVPYQVALLQNGSQNCGGSIISANWVLTAAHCVRGASASSLSVRVGSSTWNSGGYVIQIIKNIIHPRFAMVTFADCDYALLQTATPIPIGQPGVAAIQLAEVDPADGAMALISGWGQDYYRILNLKKVNLPIVSRAECRDAYGPGGITDRMICAGWPEGGRNTCYGDSGGPLVVDNRQVGIVSWATDCALGRYPTVFSDVANQREWIRENSGV